MTTYLLGLDIGGTFSKAALFDPAGHQIACASAPTRTIIPHPGMAERCMDELWDSVCTCIRQAIETAGIMPVQIVGASLSGHGKGLYMVGWDGAPAYNGILSADNRAYRQVERWKQQGLHERVYDKTYQDILVSQPVSLLAWFMAEKPDILERVQYIFSVKDYVRYKLTGETYAEYTDFSGGNLLNLNTGDYDDGLLELFGLKQLRPLLPPLKAAADIAGYINQEAAKATALPAGIPVAAGMFDVDACGIASGLTDSGQLCMIAGTWSINEYIAKAPVRDKSVALNSMYCLPGYYLVEESSPTSAGNLEWYIRHMLGAQQQEARKMGVSFYDYLNQQVESLEPQHSALLYLPFIHGSADNPLARGALVGLEAFHEQPHVLRAIYEGVVFSHLHHVRKLLKNRPEPAVIRLTGGASNSPVWAQIFADALQHPLEIISNKELGAQGAAIAAGIAAGVYRDYADAVNQTVKISKTVFPRSEYAGIYEQKYEQYTQVARALNPLWPAPADAG